MFCAKCGKEMEDNAKFCPSCGAEASGETTSEQPAAEQPTAEQPTAEQPTAEQPVAEQPAAEQPAAATAQPAAGPVGSEPSTGGAVGALVCGIIAMIFCWIPFVNIIGLILGIVAMVLGGKARKILPEGKRGMATAGFVLGIIALIISIIYLIIVIAAIAAIGSLAYTFGSLY